MDLTSAEKIKALARQYKIHPSTLLGQHFLVDEQVLCSMVKTADIRPEDVVLEIGPGFGALTRELLSRAKKVVAVEKDKTLALYLKKQFKGHDNFMLETGDILKFTPPAGSYRIIANIPYQITGKIIRKFVGEEIHKPTDMLIMVQKEVGTRVCAQPGKMNLMAIWVQLYGQPTVVRPVSRQSFWPVPKVDSALLSISGIKPAPLYKIGDLLGFWRVLKIGFSAPRKQLHNNLAAGLHLEPEAVKQCLSRLGLGEKVRAQELGLKEWIRLSEELAK